MSKLKKEYIVYFEGTIGVMANSEDEAIDEAERELNGVNNIFIDTTGVEEV